MKLSRKKDELNFMKLSRKNYELNFMKMSIKKGKLNFIASKDNLTCSMNPTYIHEILKKPVI